MKNNKCQFPTPHFDILLISLSLPLVLYYHFHSFGRGKREGEREWERERERRECGIGMEGGNARPDEEHNWRVMSPEIEEIGEGSKSVSISSRDCGMNDVYVAVGKNDLDVVKWALDHATSPGATVFLVHVFPPVTYISTPGKTN